MSTSPKMYLLEGNKASRLLLTTLGTTKKTLVLPSHDPSESEKMCQSWWDLTISWLTIKTLNNTPNLFTERVCKRGTEFFFLLIAVIKV